MLKLTKKMQDFINYSLSHPRLSERQICEAVDVTQKSLCQWKKNPDFVEAFDEALRKNWASYAKEASSVIHELLYSEKQDVALKAATYLMDSCGFKATDKVELSATDIININITGDE